MLDLLTMESNKALTLNGGQTRSTSGSHCLDLFFRAGAMRNAASAEIADVIRCAFAEDPVRTMKTLFFVRDVRGGLGERRFLTAVSRAETVSLYTIRCAPCLPMPDTGFRRWCSGMSTAFRRTSRYSSAQAGQHSFQAFRLLCSIS